MSVVTTKINIYLQATYIFGGGVWLFFAGPMKKKTAIYTWFFPDEHVRRFSGEYVPGNHIWPEIKSGEFSQIKMFLNWTYKKK